MKRGISLLEVLIAIFVTAVGLLACAALIPVGSFQIGEANKNTRAWDLAQAASRQIRVQDMLNPQRWTDGGGFPAPSPGNTFAIDPYYFARNGGIYATPITSQPECWFPCPAAEDVTGGAFPRVYQVPRLTLTTWGGSSTPAMLAEPYSDSDGNGKHDSGEPFRNLPIGSAGPWDDRSMFAERMFTGHDDLVFNVPDDRQLRPTPTVNSFSKETADSGDYSWMVTASADPLNPSRQQLSIVVFHKRPVLYDPSAETPSERTVFADVDGDGRSALLYYTAGPTTNYLDIKSGSWLLLTGTLLSGQKVARWYRVVAVGDPEDDTPASTYMRRRRVTLAGPDAQLQERDRTGAIIGPLFVDRNTATPDPAQPTLDLPTFHATIVTGVANVFERSGFE